MKRSVYTSNYVSSNAAPEEYKGVSQKPAGEKTGRFLKEEDNLDNFKYLWKSVNKNDFIKHDEKEVTRLNTHKFILNSHEIKVFY